MAGYVIGIGNGAAIASQAFFPGVIDPQEQPAPLPGVSPGSGRFFDTWGPVWGLSAAEMFLIGRPSINGGLSGSAYALSMPSNQTRPPAEVPPCFWLGLRLGPSHRAMLFQGSPDVG